jgi:hypothetical protein
MARVSIYAVSIYIGYWYMHAGAHAAAGCLSPMLALPTGFPSAANLYVLSDTYALPRPSLSRYLHPRGYSLVRVCPVSR